MAAERNGRRLVVTVMRAEARPVPVDTQAARLLDYGFELRPGTPAVGTLVDRPPPEESGDDSRPPAAPGPSAEPEHRLAGFLTIGGGALLGGLLSMLLARRRPPGRYAAGRH